MNDDIHLWRQHRRAGEQSDNPQFPTALKRPQIALLDPDIRRRAEVSHALSLVGIFAEPFASAAELPDSASRKLLVIVDTGKFIEVVLRALQPQSQRVRFMVYAEHAGAQDVVNAMRQGALNYFTWPSDCPQMALAIERFANGDREFAPPEDVQSAHSKDVLGLTERERDVLSGIDAGRSLSEISSELGISKGTVAAHRANIVRKLGVRDVREAAMKHALMRDPGRLPADGDMAWPEQSVSGDDYPATFSQSHSQMNMSWGGRLSQISLTPRELEIVKHIYEGHSVKSVARLLDISNRTVESHKASIYRKFNVNNNASLIRYVIENNII